MDAYAATQVLVGEIGQNGTGPVDLADNRPCPGTKFRLSSGARTIGGDEQCFRPRLADRRDRAERVCWAVEND